jgi:hypothetical protein
MVRTKKDKVVLRERKCGYSKCKNRLTPTRKWQKFCSEQCRYKAWAEKQKKLKKSMQ